MDNSEPRLLAGGNPQVAKGDGPEVVEAYLAAMPGWKQEVGRAVDAIVVAAVPDVRKAVRWNSPFYGVEGSGWFLSFHCLTRSVKLTFFNGASLDPQPPLAMKDPNARCVGIGEGEPVDEAQLRAWCEQAAQVPGWAGF